MTEIRPMPENKKRGGGEEAGGERKRRKTRSRGRGGVRKEWVPEGARGTRDSVELVLRGQQVNSEDAIRGCMAVVR